MFLCVILEYKNVEDLINRASAVTTLLNADKDIMTDQENDLKQIEMDKEEIAKHEEQLAVEQEKSHQTASRTESKFAKKTRILNCYATKI